MSDAPRRYVATVWDPHYNDVKIHMLAYSAEDVVCQVGLRLAYLNPTGIAKFETVIPRPRSVEPYVEEKHGPWSPGF